MSEEKWFVYRQQFQDFKELDKVIEWVKEKVEKKQVVPCIFPGNVCHWFWSLKYSIEGERDYALWGDTVTGMLNIKGRDETSYIPPKIIVENYESSYLDIKEGERNITIKVKNKDQVTPMIGLFYVTNVGIIGFGVVTDITLDAFRNFKYWAEGNDKYYITRWRIRVLWIPKGIRECLSKYNECNEDKIRNCFNDAIKELEKENKKMEIDLGSKQTNNCFSKEEEKEKAIEAIRKILSDEQEIEKMREFYSFPSHSLSIPIENVEEVVEKILQGERKLFFIDKEVIRRVVLAATVGNVLLIGPPGVGKTSLAIEVARELSGDDYMIKVANALWFRRDVIGGETLENGSVKWVSGFLIQAYNKAVGRQRPYFIIIDELNRADVDKAFGEFFTIFKSPNHDDWEIPMSLIDEIKKYGDKIDPEARKFMEYVSSGKKDDINNILRHIRIIATMNVADLRNLFMVGEALLRRFFIIKIDCPNFNKEDKKAEELEKFINKIVEENLTKGNLITDDLINKLVNFIKSLQNKLQKENEKEEKSSICISPGAIKNASIMLTESLRSRLISSNDRNKVLNDYKNILREFAEYLKSSLGIVDENEIKKFDEAVNETLRSYMEQGASR